MRISDWSSDVCSSDLPEFPSLLVAVPFAAFLVLAERADDGAAGSADGGAFDRADTRHHRTDGSAARTADRRSPADPAFASSGADCQRQTQDHKALTHFFTPQCR